MLRKPREPFPEIDDWDLNGIRDFGDLIRRFGEIAAKRRLEAARVAPKKRNKKGKSQ